MERECATGKGGRQKKLDFLKDIFPIKGGGSTPLPTFFFIVTLFYIVSLPNIVYICIPIRKKSNLIYQIIYLKINKGGKINSGL